MSSPIADTAAELSPTMRRVLLRTYPRQGRWFIPSYCYAGSVQALQRRGLADGWRLTKRGYSVLVWLRHQ